MERKLRVLLICLTHNSGQLQFNNCLADSLTKFCDVGLINATGSEQAPLDPAVHLFSFDSGSSRSSAIKKMIAPDTWSFINNVINTFDPDIVHITSAQEWNPALGLRIKNGLKKPLVYTIHDVIHHEGTPSYFKFMDDAFRKLPDYFVVLSEMGKKIICKGGAKEANVLVVPHGIYDFFTQYSAAEITEKNEILFFGRIEPYKGLNTLLDAIPGVFEKHPDWTLHIAGGGDISPYADRLNDDRIRVTNRFISNEEVAEFMRKAAIVALPYLSASQSGVIPAAFAFSKAVIATDVGSIGEMVINRETGLLIPPDDAVSLEKAINLLIDDPDLRRKLGANGLEFANQNLNWNAIALKHADFYSYILEKESVGVE